MGRERKFLASWQTNRPLLRYDAGQNVMFCDACSSAKDLGQRYGVETWVQGNRSFKLETIKHHETAVLNNVMIIHICVANFIIVWASKNMSGRVNFKI